MNVKNNSKQIWNTVNGLLGRSNNTNPVSVEVDGMINPLRPGAASVSL